MDIEISLPHLYTPRSYQVDVFKAYNSGIRRFVLVWHRRSGKDKTMLNFTICRMMERVGTYWYVLPTYSQARKIIWEGMGSGLHEGMPFLDHFPEELIEATNETNLTIRLVNGSMFNLIGSDQIDRVVGTNPIGIVYSEYSLQSIAAWEFVSPMLTENKGWAAFIYTPRGRDHGFHLWEKASLSKSWFVSLLTVKDTVRDAEGEDGSPVVSEQDIQEERDRGMDESLIQQEYYCSFSGYRQGSYYGPLIAQVYSENRIKEVPWDPRRPVFTVWDLGASKDATAIWFAQIEGREVFLIDYYQETALGMLHAITTCRNKPYTYSNHWAPHDIDQKQDTVGGGLKTRKQMASELGFYFRVVNSISLMDGIDHVRALLPRCYFDKNKCDMGIRALINYHKDFNKKTQDYKFFPVHDLWSHGADAFRYLALITDRERDETVAGGLKPTQYVRDFDIFGSSKSNPYDSPPDEIQIIIDQERRFGR